MAQRNFSGLALNFTMLNAEHYGVTQPVAQPESFVANASFYKMLSAAQVNKCAALLFCVESNLDLISPLLLAASTIADSMY